MTYLVAGVAASGAFEISVSVMASRGFVFIPAMEEGLDAYGSGRAFYRVFLVCILVFEGYVGVSVGLLDGSISFRRYAEGGGEMLWVGLVLFMVTIINGLYVSTRDRIPFIVEVVNREWYPCFVAFSGEGVMGNF